MAQVGEKYFFVSQSSQKGHDRFRTLLSKFWIWHAGLTFADKIDASTRAGAQRRKEQKQRIVTYLARRRMKEQKMLTLTRPDSGDTDDISSRRGQAIKRLEEMDSFYPEKKSNAYILPKGTLIHHPFVRTMDTGDDGSALERCYVFYGDDIFYPAQKPRRSRNASLIAQAMQTINDQAFEDSMDRIVKAIIQNTMRSMMGGTFGGLWMEDFAFGFERPIHHSITDKMNAGAGFVRVASVKNHSQYSYFLENYETTTFDQTVDERDIPNTYLVNMIQDVQERLTGDIARTTRLDKDIYKSVSMYNRIDRKAISFRVARNDENSVQQPRKVGKKQKKHRNDSNSNSAYMNYLELWRKAYGRTPASVVNSIRLKSHNILFSADSYDYFRQIASKDQNIPMSVRLEFSAPTVRKEHSLTELLRKGNFMALFMQKAVESSMDPDSIEAGPGWLWRSTVETEWLSPEQAAKVQTSGYTKQGRILSPAEYEETTEEVMDAHGRPTGETRVTSRTMTKAAVREKMTFDRSWGSIDYYPQQYSVDDKDRVHLTSGQTVASTSTKGFDILRFLDNIVAGRRVVDSTIAYRTSVVHTGKELIDGGARKSISSNYEGRLNALILGGQVRKLLEERTRSWRQVIRGIECPTEILFFEVEKVRINANGIAEVVQRFFIPNFVGRDAIDFIDSQVKYNSVYQYRIQAWTAVYGNRYRYKKWGEFRDEELTRDTQFDRFRDHFTKTGKFDPRKLKRGPRRNGFWYEVANKPSLRLMRLPYFICDPIRVRDFPPVPPHVDIVPYRGVADRLVLNFTPGVDDHRDKPISITTGDVSIFRKYYESQLNQREASNALTSVYETGIADTPVRYKSDDMPRNYEIYRIQHPPRSWQDFDGALVRMLDVDSGETSAVDIITPNEDYYYTFRSVDVHGNVSNPSDVLRVKLVDDQGVFPIIEPYDFEAKTRPNENYKKSFRRFLQITPTFEQLVYKDERQGEKKTSIANRRKITLGTAQDPIYGKTLKIRLTSKKSGKKIDLNVSFSHEHTKPPR